METQSSPLHVYFLPMMAPGHMIPMVDMARQFARQGVKATILTTPLYAAQISKTISRDNKELETQITIRLLEFPYRESGLPEGCEDLSNTTTSEQMHRFFNALNHFQIPVERFAAEDRPDCIIAGAMFIWSNDLAARLGITRLSFWGTGFLPLCAHHSLLKHRPHEKIGSDTEEFVIPDLPDTLKMTKQQLPETLRDDAESTVKEIFAKIFKAEAGSYGMVMNSFYELEPAYVKYGREVIGKKSWHIGPVSLCNKETDEKALRGQAASIGEEECLNWLNSKTPNSVVYVCFGSMSIFSAAQLREIAAGLEASDQPFIWVVKQNMEEEMKDWMPEGFEERMENQGLIIRGWAPQVLILDHEAVGGFVTHCGWNSVLEGIVAGVTMVTWPLSAEQFFNEKMVTQVLKVGVPVGAQAWTRRTDRSRAPINRENIEIAVKEVMIGEEAEERRSRAIALGNMAKKAVEPGGSSDTDLRSLLEELRKNRK